jgi:hypothetical protein
VSHYEIAIGHLKHALSSQNVVINATAVGREGEVGAGDDKGRDSPGASAQPSPGWARRGRGMGTGGVAHGTGTGRGIRRARLDGLRRGHRSLGLLGCEELHR